MTQLEDIIRRLHPVLGGTGKPEPGELVFLLDELKAVVGQQYHTDPVFHARVSLAERLIHALKPDDTREAAAMLTAILPLVDRVMDSYVEPRTGMSPRFVMTVPPGADDDGIASTIHEYAARLTRERHERLEAMCRLSLDDPDQRGVLIVRDPVTGEETMTLDAGVPWCTIHDYPQGKND